MQQPVNVLLLIDQSGARWSSQEDFCLQMIKELRERGGTCVVAYSSQPAESVRSRLILEGGVVLVASQVASLTRFCLDVRSICRQFHISTVHLMHYPLSTSLTFLLPFFLNANVILSDCSGGAGNPKSHIKQKIFRLFNRCMNFGVAHFIAPSRFVHDRMVSFRGISTEKTTLIFNGIDLDRFAPATAKESARQKLDLQPCNTLILVACNLYPLKAVDVLIRSFAIVKEKTPNCVLAIAGDGPERGKLAELAGELNISDSVIFLGQRSDMPELLAAADIFCCPSVWGEAFGWVNAEAMACGVPVVAAATGAVSEVVVHGETGLLTPPGDERAMANALLKLIGLPKERAAMGLAGRRRVETLFDLNQNIQEHLALYQRVQSGSTGQ